MQNRVIFKRGLGSGYYKKKRGLAFLRSLTSWFGLPILIVSVAIYFLFFSSYFQIQEIKIIGPKTIDSQLVLASVQSLLSQKVYKFFPGNNFFLVSGNRLEGKILEDFPKIKSVLANKIFPKGLEIKIEEREMAGIYCDVKDPHLFESDEVGGPREKEPEIQEDCFYFDSSGVVFEKAPKAIGPLILKIKNYIPGKEIDLGQKVLDESLIKEFDSLKRTLAQDLSLALREFMLSAIGEARVKTSQGFELYLDLTRDIASQVLVLKEAWGQISPEEKEKLEYIDLRIENRVYYK